jgi:hypothetical protein
MIEQVLERIAVALEKIAARDTGVPTPTSIAKKSTPVATDAVPGVEDTAPVEGATVMMCRGVTDSKGLQDFTQKALQTAGAQANELVTYIRGSVCAKFSPNEPKLVKIPVENIPAAAQMIYDWCMKHNIILS